MATSLTIRADTSAATASSVRWFAAAVLLTAFASCALAGWAPLGFSIVTVFLFAGPHNWLEARYMMTRMPARWGRLRSYFLIGLLGVPVLVAAFLVMTYGMRAADVSRETWAFGTAAWNSFFLIWFMTLVLLRRNQNPRRPGWIAIVPLTFVVLAANWMWPFAWVMVLVYLHPLLALWFLDRELGKRRPQWQAVYRWCLLAVPVLLGLMWWKLAGAADLPGEDILTQQITHHAGSTIITGVSSHLLVSTHTFLESLHYAVWIIAIPLVSIRMAPWRMSNVPLAKKTPGWRIALLSVLALGALVMLGLWAAFVADYPLTRDLYFSVAMLHVLAEFPFLLRLL